MPKSEPHNYTEQVQLNVRKLPRNRENENIDFKEAERVDKNYNFFYRIFKTSKPSLLEVIPRCYSV